MATWFSRPMMVDLRGRGQRTDDGGGMKKAAFLSSVLRHLSSVGKT
jgi:hypothetical protein